MITESRGKKTESTKSAKIVFKRKESTKEL